jgi:hypothetical protein
MKCNKCGYNDSGSGDMAHVCQRPSFRYGEHPTSFGLFNPKQEPVAWMNDEGDVVTDPKWAKDQGYTIPLYTTLPQRTWVGLTWNDVPDEWVGKVAFIEGAKWADKQLKEKNT